MNPPENSAEAAMLIRAVLTDALHGQSSAEWWDGMPKDVTTRSLHLLTGQKSAIERTIQAAIDQIKPVQTQTIKTAAQMAREALIARAAAEIAEAEAEEIQREATAPTRADMEQAVEVLQGSERGLATLRGVLGLLDDSALGLDYRGQNAVVTLLQAAWGSYAGSTRDCMRDALGENSTSLPNPARSTGKRSR